MQANDISTVTSRAWRWGVALALACSGQSLWADTPTYCVNNDSDLVSALSIAQNTALTIQLVQHTYHLNQTVWNTSGSAPYFARFHAGSSLLGGYIDANCTSRNIAVGNTIITDTTSSRIDAFEFVGDATIEGITFELPTGLLIQANDGGAPLPTGSTLSVRRNVFRQTTDGVPLGVIWRVAASSGGTIRVVNNLIHDNSVTGAAGAIDVFLLLGKPAIELINNTVVNNGGDLRGFYLYNEPASVPVYAFNNIFYGNAGKDFEADNDDALTLVDNVIGTHTWLGTATNTDTKTGDPQLDANFRPIEAPASYVINSGTANNVKGGLPPTDLSGRARQIGSAPDRGAFESTINNLPILSVTTTADSGIGSLRSAIATANANNPPAAFIFFDLGPDTGCPYTIAPLTPLPQITSSIAFAGYSQAGSSRNTLPYGFDANLCVILDGTPHNLSDGLYVSASAGDGIEVQISGLAFSGFSHGAVSLYGGSGHTLTGSKIGGNTGGVALDPSGNGVIIGPAVHDVTIGGGDFFDAIDARNLIGSATGGGIVVDGAAGALVAGHDNRITGNFIGAGYNGNTGTYVDRGNGSAGVTLAGPGNYVSYNFIGYNGSYGINITNSTASGNIIDYNAIGAWYSYDDTGAGNGGGIVVQNAAHDNVIVGDIIRYNSGTGVRIVNGQGNSISVTETLGNNGLGIDLAGAGVTANDNDSDPQVANYANRGQNFPLLDSAIGGHTHGRVTGSLLSLAGTYRFEVYVTPACDASGHGEGRYYMTSFLASTGNLGANGQFLAPFTADFDIPSVFAAGAPRYITMTATDSAGNTSEFSSCLLYTDDTIFAGSFDFAD